MPRKKKMNDRFRFRAWSKEEKKYYYDVEQTYDYMQGIMSGSFGELLEDDRYIIEQCTGIKDCNGKLIYEGDLIRSVDEIREKQGVVEWRDGNSTFSGSWEAVDHRPDGKRKPASYLFSNYYWEVYGNIHENGD